MPSSPDSNQPDRTRRLADVYARADRLRRQRRARMGTGALLGSLAVFMVGLLVGSNLGVIPQQLITIGPPDAPSTTTTEPPPTTTTSLPVEPDPRAQGSNTPPGGEASVQPPPPPPQAERPPESTTPTTAPPPTTSTTAPGCRNSRDPACGPFRYDPVPVNEPMAVEVTFSPQSPKAGELVTFTVRVRDDGPATPGDCRNTQTYGISAESSETVVACAVSCLPPEPRHGPWDPPPPQETSFEETFGHAYARPGAYTATFTYNPESCSENPYRSQGEASVMVIVR